MSEPHLISPMLDPFVVGEAFSDHDGVRCFPAIKKDTQDRYILKIISIPASQIRLQALLMTGAYKTEEDAMQYFVTLSKEVTQEVAALEKLAGLEGFLPYEACQVVKKQNEIGLDIYLLSPYRKSLQRHMKKNVMSHLAAINLGLDLCACMALCRQVGYLFVDLKPSNIYLLDDKTFRIGDIGFMNLSGLKYASLPERYLSEYTAPEITDAFCEINTTVDIFSIGLILYQIYNGGVLPKKGELAAPEYADYELAEIIMKACDSDPAKRWQDPVQMGQALKSYMQRNGVNDVPIVPPPPALDSEEVVPFEEENDGLDDTVMFEQVDEAGQLMIEAMIDYDQAPGAAVGAGNNDEKENAVVASGNGAEGEDDDPANLSFLDELVSDETAPGEDTVSGVTYNELSDETSNILSIADDLIAMEVPPPVVAPEASEIPVPVPVVAKPKVETDPVIGVETEGQENVVAGIEEGAEEAESGAEDATIVVPVVVGDDTDSDVTENGEDDNVDAAPVFTEGETKVIPSGLSEGNSDAEGEEFEEDTEDDAEAAIARRSMISRILTFTLVGLILVSLIFGGYLFYRDYYLKTVDSLTLQGFEDRLNVQISSTADDELLTVICTDTYGNKLTAPVVDGTASFGGLNADTLYTVVVEISGFHGLSGKVKDTYTTAPRTDIVTFSAITGAEAGSVILSFTVNGQDSDEWTVTYVTEGEAEHTQVFTGHMITISGLTVGKPYTFTLESTDDLYVVGNNSVEYLASDLIYPEELKIESCNNEGLSVTWNAPEGSQVSSWTALCYNNSGYSQTLTTSETTAVFTGIDPKSAYTVEVSAAGMSVSSRCYMTENAVSATNISTEVKDGGLNVTWNYSGTAPTAKWVVLYSYEGSDVQEIIRSDSTSVRIFPIIPGITYDLVISLEDGTTVFTGTASVEIPAAKDFAGYLVTKNNIRFQMCLAPDKDNWTWRNVRTYKETFTKDETAAFVMRLDRTYNTSPDMITTMFVIRNAEGIVVSMSHTSQTWTSMWYQSYGELEVPSIPETAGTYTMDIYFNGAYVHTHTFTVQ